MDKGTAKALIERVSNLEKKIHALTDIQGEKNEESVPDANSGAAAVFTPKRSTSAQSNTLDQHSHKTTPWWEPWLKRLGIVAGIAYTFITYFLWSDARDNFKRDQRAWLTVTQATLSKPIAIGETPRVLIQITNSGRTPALDAALAGNLVSRRDISLAGLADKPNGDQISSSVIGPNVTMTSDVDSTEAISRQEQIDAVMLGPWRLYASGTIIYTDVFKKSHTTRFCFKANGESIRLVGLVMSSCDRGNTAD